MQSNIISEVKKLERQNKNKKFMVILPVFNTEFNFSKHEIFRYDWDFPNAIKLRSGTEIKNRYHVINNLNQKNIEILQDKIILDGHVDIEYSNLELLKYMSMTINY